MRTKKSSSASAGNAKQSHNQVTNSIAETTTKGKGVGKNKYWVGVLYPENMRPNWQNEIGDIVQLPYAYCLHNSDNDSQSEHRKDHIHLILVWPATTTYNHAMSVFNKLSADGKKALNTIEAVINIRSKYEYLIHNTETCRKLGKELYPAECRITGNNFDIGAYEQLGVTEKRAMCKELCQAIIDNGFINFTDFYEYALFKFDDNYFEVMQTYSGLFERLTKGNYQRWQMGKLNPQPKVDPETGEVIDDDEVPFPPV